MQNFFEKLPKIEVEKIFRKGVFEKSQLTTEGRTKETVKVTLNAEHLDKFGRLYILPLEVFELKDKVCAFSFRIGTRVFFFKNKVLQDARGFFIQTGYELLELRRRRHVRFEIPENFQHECFMITSVNKSARVESWLINFSESGAKVRVSADLVLFQKGNTVILSLKVGKRAAFLVGCQIRFVMRKPKENPELGLEFINVTDIKQSRILNVCEDLSRLIVQTHKKQRK